MPKKPKTRPEAADDASAPAPAVKKSAAKAKSSPKAKAAAKAKTAAKTKSLAKTKTATKAKLAAKTKIAAKAKAVTKPKGAAKSKSVAKPRSAAHLQLSMPMARARKLAGDLYQSAGLNLWSEAIEQAVEPERATLIHLQDAICDAADFLKTAKSANPKKLKQFWIACFDRQGLPTTKPAFVTAANEEQALEIWRETFKGEFGVRKPRAHLVPDLAEAAGLQPS